MDLYRSKCSNDHSGTSSRGCKNLFLCAHVLSFEAVRLQQNLHVHKRFKYSPLSMLLLPADTLPCGGFLSRPAFWPRTKYKLCFLLGIVLHHSLSGSGNVNEQLRTQSMSLSGRYLGSDPGTASQQCENLSYGLSFQAGQLVLHHCRVGASQCRGDDSVLLYVQPSDRPIKSQFAVSVAIEGAWNCLPSQAECSTCA